MATTDELRALLDQIRQDDGASARQFWNQVRDLLKRAKADTLKSAQVFASRKPEALEALIAEVEERAKNPQPDKPRRVVSSGSPGFPVARITTRPPSEEASGPYQVTDMDRKMALKAFKKRMKMTRLNDESKLGGRYTSGGHTSAIVGIVPPTEFRREIWDSLIEEGKLKRVGAGLLALTQ